MSWRKGIAALLGITGVGYALMKLTVPSPNQLYDKMSEAEKKEVDKKRAAVKKDWDLIADFIKSNAQSDRPAWDVQIPKHILEAGDRINQANSRKP
ncbi:hypothetical protein K502DRAFT_324921 [Neoconidiobolus thromboides FSU 785]|nr:hypothetical protein K502DRAFT_324921 [Neoconidiobolus thromboides FSU 785]